MADILRFYCFRYNEDDRLFVFRAFYILPNLAHGLHNLLGGLWSGMALVDIPDTNTHSGCRHLRVLQVHKGLVNTEKERGKTYALRARGGRRALLFLIDARGVVIIALFSGMVDAAPHVPGLSPMASAAASLTQGPPIIIEF